MRDDKKMSRYFEFVFKIRDFFEEEEVLFESEKDYWYRWRWWFIRTIIRKLFSVKKEQIPLEIYI